MTRLLDILCHARAYDPHYLTIHAKTLDYTPIHIPTIMRTGTLPNQPTHTQPIRTATEGARMPRSIVC